jgi:hypothetical protein
MKLAWEGERQKQRAVQANLLLERSFVALVQQFPACFSVSVAANLDMFLGQDLEEVPKSTAYLGR